MGLFDKKYCDVCGEKLGLLFGKRKLEDGTICADCAKKLSFWFDERRHSTVEDIKAQLAYREENLEKVKAFNVTRSYGRYTKVLFDEDKRQFMVTRTGSLLEENPDVLDFAQVTGCDLDIDEQRGEEKRRTDEGEEVSYVPPRYYWTYAFNMIIRVNHPYFDDMRFSLNSGRVKVEPGSYSTRTMIGSRVGSFNPRQHPDYLEFAEMGQEIKDMLTNIRVEQREIVAAAAAPKVASTCIACGASGLGDANGCCEYCGTPLPK